MIQNHAGSFIFVLDNSLSIMKYTAFILLCLTQHDLSFATLLKEWAMVER